MASRPCLTITAYLTALYVAVTPPSAASAAPPLADLADYWLLRRFQKDQHHVVAPRPAMRAQRLAKAEKDECFAGVGAPYPPKVGDACTGGSTPKSNQSYLWAMTQVDDLDLWLGTYPNGLCVDLPVVGSTPQEIPGYWVCERAAASSGTGDFRAPRVYRFDPALQELVDESPSSGPAATLLADTMGLRSAGNQGGVVFLAGPSRAGTAIHLFAYDAETAELLGARALSDYNDIRSWLTVGDALYAGVGAARVESQSDPGGFVIRWTGAKSTDPDLLFRFEVVGRLDAPAANLALHDGSIFVNTWPVFSGGLPDLLHFRFPGLFRGPALPATGLTEEHAGGWQKVWTVTDYEPDRAAAMLMLGGALSSHAGSLYWGSMALPGTAALLAIQAHEAGALDLDADDDGQLDAEEILTTFLGTHRPVSLFRGFAHGREDARVELVYGEKYLPTYDPTAKAYRIAYDTAHQNRMGGRTPLWGASGFGNFFNAYVWSMQRFEGSLFIGTFDWSQIFRVGLTSLVQGALEARTELAPLSGLTDPLARLSRLLDRGGLGEGGDLLRIDDASGRAHAESLDGLENPTNYGIRTMVSRDRQLFVGTANAMNLHPRGGWELWGLTPVDSPPRQHEPSGSATTCSPPRLRRQW